MLKPFSFHQFIFLTFLVLLLVGGALVLGFSPIPAPFRRGVTIALLLVSVLIILLLFRRNPLPAAKRFFALGLLSVGSAGAFSVFGTNTLNLSVFGQSLSFNFSAFEITMGQSALLLAFAVICYLIAARVLLHVEGSQSASNDALLGPDWADSIRRDIKGDISLSRPDLHQSLSDELFVNTHELARLYIEPDCQPDNPADSHEENPISSHRAPVSKYLEKFLKKSFVEKDGSQVLFILSDAGMGKSSLLAMLALSSEIRKQWPAGVAVEFLKLGCKTLEMIDGLRDKPNTVLLLDALDEDPQAVGRVEARLQELLAKARPFRQVVISVRTQFFPSVDGDINERLGTIRVFGNNCSLIYLSPFSDEQVISFLKKKYPNVGFSRIKYWFTGEQNADFQKAHSVSSRMQSLRLRPMLLQHIDKFAAREDVVDELTEFTVYEQLVAEWLYREERKSTNLSASQIFFECTELAIALQKMGSRIVSEDGLRLLLQKKKDDDLGLLRINLTGLSLINKTSDSLWRFSHYSIQEFLVARSFVLLNSAERQAILSDRSMHATIRATDLMVSFLEQADLDLELDHSGLCGFDFADTPFAKAQRYLSKPTAALDFPAPGATFNAFGMSLLYLGEPVTTMHAQIAHGLSTVPVNILGWQPVGPSVSGHIGSSLRELDLTLEVKAPRRSQDHKLRAPALYLLMIAKASDKLRFFNQLQEFCVVFFQPESLKSFGKGFVELVGFFEDFVTGDNASGFRRLQIRAGEVERLADISYVISNQLFDILKEFPVSYGFCFEIARALEPSEELQIKGTLVDLSR